MKKLVIANCILAIAVIFSFCAKPDLTEELIASTDAAAGDRATCTLVNSPGNINTTITICGTNTNKTTCVPCGAAAPSATGVEVFAGSLFALNLQTPITISISNTNLTALNLTAGNNTLPTIPMPAGSCFKFHIDANCFITQIP
ncbi:MAG: hypothetical protein H7246_11295 [Phycisphaerae bacterium]|nr:hypothetical protein [Saprospiraceae bacterium]